MLTALISDRLGCFTYFCHPDMLNFTGDPEFYKEETKKFCKELKALSIPLEVNFLGIWDHRNYPREDFWKIAGEVGNDVIFGSDAHRKDKVWNPEALKTAEKIAEKYHLHVIETVDFRNPKL